MFKHLTDIQHLEVPLKLQYPHYYLPHDIAVHAANMLKFSIPTRFPNNSFGTQDDGTVGKMFGVLIVKSEKNELGYLEAFSGKIEENSAEMGFVPSIFDLQSVEGYYKKREAEITKINERVADLEQGPELLRLRQALELHDSNSVQELADCKARHKLAKAKRKKSRREAELLSESEQKVIIKRLAVESQNENFELRDLKRDQDNARNEISKQLQVFEEELEKHKSERSAMSSALQNWIFESYVFTNKLGDKTDPIQLFAKTSSKYPPSGAGDCAAPKLFQYAIDHKLTPIALAEFWYGASPSGVIRKHGKFYTACKGKCEPILDFYMQGMPVEENPLHRIARKERKLNIVYEDAFMVAVNKPFGMLSVPGKEISNSAFTKLEKEYEELYIIHRLDMATSGILLFAKSVRVFKAMQRLFSDRKVIKTYEAILDGSPEKNKGTIDLRLAQSFINRPMQMHSKSGKLAITDYEVVGSNGQDTFIKFYPSTGKTHQLRMHASHHEGLNCPIKGDLLYGNPSDRMYLHAAKVRFLHPETKQEIVIACPSNFF